jgi:uncharacterized membrane protein YesL
MFDLDSLFGRKAALGKGVNIQPPKKGIARFLFLAYTHFAKLIGLNMLFLLFCIPVITIPAAVSGLNRVCVLLVREGTCSVWSDFIKEFKCSFFKSIPLAVFCAFLFADAAICVYFGQIVESDGTAALLLFAAIILCTLAILISCYTFVLLPLVALRNRDILRDAVSLIVLQPKTDLFLVIFVGGSIAAATAFFPYTVPIIAVIWPAILSLAVCTVLNEPIQNRIVDQTRHPI